MAIDLSVELGVSVFSFRRGVVRPVLYHLHIPKAAGTTLYDLLRTRFLRWRRCPVRVSSLDLIRIPRSRFARYDLVGGHLEFGYHLPEYMGRPVRVVTMLREPRALLLSLYKQVMQEPLDPVRKYVDANCPTVESFFFDGRMSEYVANPQTRFLGQTERRFTVPLLERLRGASEAEASLLVSDAAGATPRLTNVELLDQARGRLADCAAVGLVERFDESAERLCAVLGWKPFKRVASRNVSSVKVKGETLPPRLLRRLDELTVLDRVLYDEAVARFDAEGSTRRRAA